jgi:hypothetical protein
MDYFVSADLMEHPFRSRMPVLMEPYTEQVILLSGQGIWYYEPEDPAETIARTNVVLNIAPRVPFTRQDFGFQDEWRIFFVPQSVFKMHPLFDAILAEVLAGDERAHIVVTGGRRPRWTAIYQHRLTYAVGGYNISLLSRLHIVPRVSSEKFIDLLHICDIVLHPFPFDGSRTSADALIAGKPFVTLPAEYLRGRMGQSFLRTMNIPQIVAHNRSEYVSIALNLSRNRTFYDEIRSKITANLHLIWEDMEVPFEWSNLLSTMVGLPSMQWRYYLKTIHKYNNVSLVDTTESEFVTKHTNLWEIRTENRAEFERVWGREDYLLRVADTEHIRKWSGVAVLEEELTPNQIPMIFNNWKSMPFGNHSLDGVLLPHSVKFIEGTGEAQPLTAGAAASELSAGGPREDKAMPPSHNSNIDVFGIKEHIFTTHMTTEMPAISVSLVGHGKVQDPVAGQANALNKQWILDSIRSYSQKALYDQAFTLAHMYKPLFLDDPQYLFEYGAIQFFRSDYDSAYEHCFHVTSHHWPTSIEAQACVGVSALYLGLQDQCIKALVTAWGLDKTRNDTNENNEFTSSANFTFKAKRPSIEFNLVSALATFKRSKECVDVGTMITELPPVDAGGAYIAIFSVVDWSLSHEGNIDKLEQLLRETGHLDLPHRITLLSEIRRLQKSFAHILSPLVDCVCDYLKRDPLLNRLNDRIIGELMSIVTPPASASMRSNLFSQQMHSTGETIGNYFSRGEFAMSQNRNQILATREAYNGAGLTLITQHFNASKYTRTTEMMTDMSRALQRNLNNAAVSQVYLLNEEHFNYSSFRNNWKIKQFVIGNRLTFTDAFEFASVHLANRTVAVGKCDIILDRPCLIWYLFYI